MEEKYVNLNSLICICYNQLNHVWWRTSEPAASRAPKQFYDSKVQSALHCRRHRPTINAGHDSVIEPIQHIAGAASEFSLSDAACRRVAPGSLTSSHIIHHCHYPQPSKLPWNTMQALKSISRRPNLPNQQQQQQQLKSVSSQLSEYLVS